MSIRFLCPIKKFFLWLCYVAYGITGPWPGLESGSQQQKFRIPTTAAAAAAKLLQSCPTLCDPIDGSPPGSAVPGILQARTLEWVAISFSNAGKWKVKSANEVAQSCLTLCDLHGLQPTRLLCPWDFPGKSTGVGCHCLLLPKHRP